MRDRGDLLEWAEYSGNLYGTPRAPVLKRLASGDDVLLDIEVKGAMQVKESERRLRNRGDTALEDIERRLSIARWQLAEARQRFDHVVVNDSVEAAVERILRILSAPSTKADR